MMMMVVVLVVIVELCAYVIVSPVNFGWRRRRLAPTIVFKDSRKNSFYFQNFLMTFFSHQSKIAACSPHNGKLLSFFPFLRLQACLICRYFRPISITPVLSRLLERLIVHTFIYPTFITPPMAHQLSDQYASRPTGSTTAALFALH